METMQLHLLDASGRYGDAVHDCEPVSLRPARALDAPAHARRLMRDPSSGVRGFALMTPERAATMKRGRLPSVGSLRTSAWRRALSAPRTWPKWPMAGRNALDYGERDSIAAAVAAMAPLVKRIGRVTLWGPDAGERAAAYSRALAETVTGEECISFEGGRRRIVTGRELLERHGYTVAIADPADWTSGAVDVGRETA